MDIDKLQSLHYDIINKSTVLDKAIFDYNNSTIDELKNAYHTIIQHHIELLKQAILKYCIETNNKLSEFQILYVNP